MQHIGGNVFQKVSSEYYQLTTSEKKVADYVIGNRYNTQFMSISELAEECGVAEATVSRFCRTLGYKGYNAFKLAVANSAAQGVGEYRPTGEPSPEDSIQEMCQKLYGNDIEALAQTLALVRPENVAAAGVILSEYPPGTEHKGSHSPVRNRITSGLCLGAVIIEAPRRSGALITAHAALEQGRDVFAVPGPIDAPCSQGTNQLLQEGAIPAISAGAILAEYARQYPHKLRLRAVETPEPLGPRNKKAAGADAPEAPVQEADAPELPVLDLGADHGLTDDQIRILRSLEGGTLQVDDIIEATQIPARRVLSALTLLEVEERVRQESGKRFTLAVTLQ